MFYSLDTNVYDGGLKQWIKIRKYEARYQTLLLCGVGIYT
jgi:hypothetical protein